MVKDVKQGIGEEGQGKAAKIQDIIRDFPLQGPLLAYTPTPARKPSSRGDWTVGNNKYRGPSKPDKAGVSFDRRWEQFSAIREYNTNSMAALMEYNLYRLMKRLEGQLKAASPGSIKSGYRVQTGRRGTKVWVSLNNVHPAWGYVMAGTATRRVVDWKKGLTNEAYPIIPIRGPWAINKAGYITPEDRRKRIDQFQDLLAEMREEIDAGEGSELSEARDWMQYALKLEGDWVAPDDDEEGDSVFKVKSPELGLIPQRKPFVNKKGEVIPRKKTNKRGEAYIYYLEAHPGIKPHRELARTMRKWGDPDYIRAQSTPIASNLAKEIAAVMLSGGNIHTNKEQGSGLTGMIQLKNANININLVQRRNDAMQDMMSSFQEGFSRRSRWK